MKIKFTISILLLAGNLWAQTPKKSALASDVSLLQKAFSNPIKVRLTDQFALSRENPNELQWVMSGLFLFYKSFISSQDNQRCSFHPSCSEYGLEAVKKLGMVRGMICTCDRLTRCNGFSPQQYEIDQNRRKLSDPVSW